MMDMDGAAVTEQVDERAVGAPAPTTVPAPAKPQKSRKVRNFWLKQMHTWHWISAAMSLIGMFLFAITGFTLNHAASIGATPVVKQKDATLPAALLEQIRKEPAAANAPLPAPVAEAVAKAVALDPAGKPAEWSADEVYIAMPGPGRDAWVSIDRETGAISSELTNRGWISYINDLHKGRNTGTAWFWFIDIFAAACIIFTVTGLLLLQLHARHRPSTWPLVGFGLAVPVIIALFFIH